MRSGPIEPGTTYYLDIYTASVHDDPQTVTIDSVTPRVRRETTSTRFEYLVCHGPLGSAAGRAQLEKICATIEPALDREVTFGGSGGEDATLVVRITSDGPGRVVIDGYDVEYRAGLRRGTLHSEVMTTVPYRQSC